MLLSLFASSCNPVPDIVVCKERAADIAKCMKVVSEEKFDWDNEHLYKGQSYWDVRPTMIQMPPESWAQLKAYILKSCKTKKGCKEIKSKVKSIEDNSGLI